MEGSVNIPASALADIRLMIADIKDMESVTAEHEGRVYCPLCNAEWDHWKGLKHESDCAIVVAHRIEKALKDI